VSAALHLESITKSFGGVKALDDISLRLPSGSITALIGPNGSGKSTSINVVTGVLKPDSGTVTYGDDEITGVASETLARRGIVRTFQTPRLFPTLSCIENAMAGAHLQLHGNFAAQALGIARRSQPERAAREYAKTLLDVVGLSRSSDVAAGSLSTGSQKLLDLVRALMARPRLILLDEPAAGLNDQETGELGIILGALRSADLTVLFVEHNMQLVLSIADRIEVFHEGRIGFSGSPDEFRGDPTVNQVFLGGKGAGL
jgi:branched-chain amino acid transport system ATP-binding protein